MNLVPRKPVSSGCTLGEGQEGFERILLSRQRTRSISKEKFQRPEEAHHPTPPHPRLFRATRMDEGDAEEESRALGATERRDSWRTLCGPSAPWAVNPGVHGGPQGVECVHQAAWDTRLHRNNPISRLMPLPLLNTTCHQHM